MSNDWNPVGLSDQGQGGPQVLCCSRIVLEQSQTTRTMLIHSLQKSLTSFDDCENSWRAVGLSKYFISDGFESCWTDGNPAQSNNWKDKALMVFICSSWKVLVCEGNVVDISFPHKSWWRGRMCHLPCLPGDTKEKRGSPEGMFVFMRFVKGNHFSWITDVHSDDVDWSGSAVELYFFYIYVFWKSLTVTGKNWVSVIYLNIKTKYWKLDINFEIW